MDEINVVYTSDDNYVVLTGISMVSLFENNKQCRQINVYILADNISNENCTKLIEIGQNYNRKVYLINIVDSLKDLQEKGIRGYRYDKAAGGYTTYSKLLIHNLIPDKNRLIYIDGDTVVVGDITVLGSLDMHGKPIALAYDCCQNRYKKFISIDENEGYYNAGIMVFDIDKWKERRCMERIIDHISHVRSEYPLADQDFFNVVLHGDIYRLDMKYNYLSQYFLYPFNGLRKVYDLDDNYFYTKDEYVDPSQAVVLHFCGQTFIRPWYCNSKHPAKKIYDHYYNLSPWKSEAQKQCKWPLQYKIQYLLWRYSPTSLAVLCGKMMQRAFIKLNYKV